ncbi:MAG: hypothetical protein QM747_13380 [Nocardioides sp.]
MTRKRFGSALREFEVAIAHAVEELRGLDLETVDRAAPRLHAFEADAHRHVEQQRAIGVRDRRAPLSPSCR